MNVAASNYVCEMMDNSNFNMENYADSKKKDKEEHMTCRSKDHQFRGADNSTDEAEAEEMQLLPED
jgi:hypothetical protein